MKDNLSGALWRLAIFVTVCLLGVFALIAVFAQLRFQQERIYKAEFSDVSGLKEGNFVRVAGVEVGKVKGISITGDNHALVEFSANDSIILTGGSRAIIRYENLIGDRFLELADGPGDSVRLPAGATITTARTEPALDLDALIGGFRPLFRALDPDQVNQLTGELVSVFQGQGGTVESFLSNTATLTNTLADRDQLIGQVIDNLNTVVGSISAQNTQFASAIDSLTALVHELSDRRSEVVNGVAYTNAAAASLADLLMQGRPALRDTVAQTGRTAGVVIGDHDYLDNLLKTLPDAYQVFSRQGLFGDFFSFYLCDLVLKVNGKGGQPVYIKLAGQTTGRCTPR